jgi:hypothetical protein
VSAGPINWAARVLANRRAIVSAFKANSIEMRPEMRVFL